MLSLNIFHLIRTYPVSANITNFPPKQRIIWDWLRIPGKFLNQDTTYIDLTDISQPNLFPTGSSMNYRSNKSWLPTEIHSMFACESWSSSCIQSIVKTPCSHAFSITFCSSYFPIQLGRSPKHPSPLLQIKLIIYHPTLMVMEQTNCSVHHNHSPFKDMKMYIPLQPSLIVLNILS